MAIFNSYVKLPEGRYLIYSSIQYITYPFLWVQLGLHTLSKNCPWQGQTYQYVFYFDRLIQYSLYISIGNSNADIAFINT